MLQAKVYLIVHRPDSHSRSFELGWERGIYDDCDKAVEVARELFRSDTDDLTCVYAFNLNEEDTGTAVWDCGDYVP